jgi:hypothetical protein
MSVLTWLRKLVYGNVGKQGQRRRSRWRSCALRLEYLEDRCVPTNLSTTAWTSIGPEPVTSGDGNGPVSGRVTGVAADPSNASILYVATAGGGVWKTTDAGTTWNPLTDNLVDVKNNPIALFMGAVAVAPSNPQVIYAGTGEANFAPDNVAGNGILKSSDGGKTWIQETNAGKFLTESVNKIVVDPTNPQIAYAAINDTGVNSTFVGSNGIWKTIDGGNTWTMIAGFIGEKLTDVVINPVNPQQIFYTNDTLKIGGFNGVFESNDGGTTFKQLNQIPNSFSESRTALAISGDGSTLYVAESGAGGGGAGSSIYGELWHFGSLAIASGTYTDRTATTPNYMGAVNGQGLGWEYAMLAVDPSNPQVVYAGGSNVGGGPGIIESTNGGASWFAIDQGSGNLGPATGYHAAAFDAKGKLVVGSDGGAYRLENNASGSIQWTDLNSTLNTVQFNGFALDPSNFNNAYGGTQNDGVVQYAGSAPWAPLFPGAGGVVRVDPTNPSAVYAESTGFSLQRSLDGGQTWKNISAGLNGNPGTYAPYVLDPSNSARLIFGSDSLFESTDQGNTWTAIGVAGSANFNNGKNPILAIAVAPNSPNTIYVTAGSNIYVTTDDGVTWSSVGNPSVFATITGIAVDPANSQHVYIVPNSSVFVQPGQVYESLNGGQAWKNITSNLPPNPTDTITFANNTIFVGSDAGAYESTNDGASWAPIAAGLPNAQVIDLEYNTSVGILAAATHGRGLWELALPASSQVGNGILSVYGSSGADNFVLQLDASLPADLDVLNNGTLILQAPLASFNSIIVNGNGGDNSLTVNYGNGLFAQPITFDGGAGNNTLTVTGGSFTSVTDNLTGKGMGNVNLVAAGTTYTIKYTNVTTQVQLNPASDTSLNLNLPLASSNRSTLTDDGTIGNNISQLVSAGTFAKTTFTDPTDALSFNLGSFDTFFVDSLDSQFAAALTINGGLGGVNLDGPLTLGSASVPGNLAISAMGISVNNPITTRDGGTVVFTDSLGLTIATGATVLAAGAVTQTGLGSISLGANITGANISFAGPLSLAGPVTLTGATATFTNTVDDNKAGADALAVVGNAVFQSTIGAATPIASLSVNGNTSLGGDVITTGPQTYTGAATLSAAASTLTSTGGGAITFGGTLDGASALAVNTGGITTFTGVVGGTAPLTSLSTDNPGSTALNGSVATTGAQNYGDAVSLGQPSTTLTASAATFASLLDLGANTLAVVGNFDLASTAQFAVQLAGPAPTQFGHVTYTGTADLGDAQLNITRAPLFAPSRGLVFDIIGTAGTGPLTNVFTGYAEGALLNAAGQTLGVTYQGGAQHSDFVLTALSGVASQLAFVQQPTDTTAGVPLGAPVTVQVEDINGSVVQADNSTITLTVAAGPGQLGGVLSAQAVGGIATFTNLVLQTAGLYNLEADDAALAPAESDDFNVNAGSATQLTFAASPLAGVVGQPLPPLTVDLLDQFGNLASGTNLVTIAVSPGNFSAGTTTVTSSGGVAIFSDLVVPQIGSYTFAATSPSLAPITSPSFNVVPGLATQFALAQQPTDITAGQALPSLTVNLLDRFGNQSISTAAVTVTANLAGGASSPLATLSAANGVVAFSNLVLQTAGTYTLTFSAVGITPFTSASFTVSPGAASQLGFSALGNAGAGQPLAPFTVSVLDAYGNLVASTATVSLSPNGPGLFTAGTASATAVGGVASFSGLILDTAGSYTLGASATGMPTGTSAAFTVAPAAASRFVFTNPQPQGGTAGQPLGAFEVDTVDAFGNPTVSPDSTVTLTANGPAALGATALLVQQSATFSGLMLQTAGSYTFTASAPGLSSTASALIAIAPAAPAQLLFAAGPVSGSAGQALPAFAVDVADMFGNLANSSTASVSLTISGPGARAAGTTTVAAVGGVATFSGLILNTAGVYTITASSGTLAPVTLGGFNVGAAAANSLAFAVGPAATVSAGQALLDMKVQVLDAFGNPVNSNVAMTIAASGPGTLGGKATVSAVNGLATFGGLTLQAAGTYTLTVSAGSLLPASANLQVKAATASALAFSTGPTDASAGQPLAPVSVTVVDAFGNPVAGATVSVSATGPGTLGPLTAVSDASGLATYTTLSIAAAGTYTLSASIPGLTPATSSSFNITPAAASQLAFKSAPSNAGAGQLVPVFQVEILDALGNLVNSGAPVTLAVSPNAVTSGTLTVAAVNGVASFGDLVIDTAGSYSATASAVGLAAPSNLANFTVSPAAASQLSFAGAPAAATAGTALPTVQINVADAFGNPVNGTPVTLAVNGPGALSAGATTATSVNGVASFSGLVLPTAGPYTFTVSATGLAPVSSSAFTVSAAAASQLTIAASLPGTTAGQPLADFQVAIRDAFGNLVNSGDAVSVTVSSPGEISTGTTTVTAVGGIATFSGLTLDTAGSFRLSASDANLPAPVATNIAISPAAASQLAFAAVPANAVAGQPLPDVQVNVEDAFGNTIAGSGTLLTLGANGGAFSAGATLAIVKAGVADFSGLLLAQAGNYTLTVSAPGFPSVASAGFAVSPAAASQLAFAAVPASVTAGQALPNVTVQVEDALGNLVTSATAALTLTVLGPGGASAGTLASAAVGGVASFSGLVLDTAGSYVLAVSGAGLPSADSASFSVTPAGASQLLFALNPPSGTAGQPLPAIPVAVSDAFGNPVSGTPVTLTFSGASPSAGATSATASAGSARFNGLVFSTAGTYTLTAHAAGLQPVTSGTFTIAPGAATQLAFVAAPANNIAGQTLPDLQVAVLDALGNRVTTASTVVNLTGSGPAPLGATATTVQGVATFTGLALPLAGTYTLSASAPALTPAPAASLTIAPAAATQVAFASAPSATIAGLTLAPLQVVLLDSFGNRVSGTASVSLSANGPGSFSAGLTSATANLGAATFSGLVLPTAGAYTLTASAPNLTPGTSVSFVVAPAAANQLAFAPIPAGGTAGAVLPDLQVQILDPFGNLASSSAPVTLTIAGPGAPSANNLTAAVVGGVATFSGLVLDTAGIYVFTAGGAGLSTTSSTAFTVTPAVGDYLAFEPVASTATAGQTLAAVKVDVLDVFGNVSSSDTAVTLTVTGPTGRGAGNITVAAVNGVATFNNIVLPQAGSFGLFVSAAGLASPVAASVTAHAAPGSTPAPSGGSSPSVDTTPTSANPPARIKYLSVPRSGHAGKALAPVRLVVLDSHGHAVAAGTLVSLRLKSGKLSGVVQKRTDKNGAISFSGLKIAKAGPYTLLASAHGLKTSFAAPLLVLPARK